MYLLYGLKRTLKERGQSEGFPQGLLQSYPLLKRLCFFMIDVYSMALRVLIDTVFPFSKTFKNQSH